MNIPTTTCKLLSWHSFSCLFCHFTEQICKILT